MRDLSTLRADHADADRSRSERVDALLSGLEAAGATTLVVSELRAAWVRPQLDLSRGAALTGPEVPKSFIGAVATATRPDIERGTKVLAGRALAVEMLATPPSIETWDRAHDLVGFASWTAFVRTLAEHCATPEANAWASLLAAPPEEQAYLDGALAREREAIRAASLAWRAAPRLLGEGPDRSHAPLGSSYVTRLAVVAHLDPVVWFDALRAAPSRTEVEFAITSASQHPDRLLDLLGAAPAALDADGNETGQVAAIVLARRAWRYAQDVDGLLESRTRIAWDATKRALADEDRRAFRKQEVAPWFERVWATMTSRPDAATLALALVVENVAQRTYRREGRPLNEVARLADEDLENRTAAVWRPRLADLAALLDGGDLGRRLGLLPRWLAFQRVAMDDAGDTAQGARLAWVRLAETLTNRLVERDLVVGAQHVSPYMWTSAGLVLAMQPDPAAAFAALFESLWTEREQAYMGVRRPSQGSDLPVRAASSEFALGVAARALTFLPQTISCAAARAVWVPLFDGLREMWLRREDHLGRDHSWLVNWVFVCGGVAHRDARTRVPQDAGLRAELEDALAYAETEPRLVISVAASWLANEWPPADVLDFFALASIDLRAVGASLAAEPDEWRGEHRAELSTVLDAIDRMNDASSEELKEPE